jgi:1-acyl-sn-glycerol-3-phosphate acyltransferase
MSELGASTTQSNAALAPPMLLRQTSDVDVRALLNITSPETNPFISRTLVMPWLQRLKLFITAITLFPIRVLLTVLIIVFASLIAVIGTAGLRRSAYERPLSRWRRIVLWPVRPLIRLVLFVIGVWVTVHGRPAPKTVAPIVVSNHLGFLEPSYLVAALGCCAVSAAENLNYPIVGGILVALQCIFVVRDKQGISGGKPVRNDKVAPAAPEVQLTPQDPSLAFVTDTPNSPHVGLPAVSAQAPRNAEGAVAKITARALDPEFGRVLIFPEGVVTNGTAVVQVGDL